MRYRRTTATGCQRFAQAPMRCRILMVGFALAGTAPLPALAESVDRLTCAQAIRVVQTTNSYEKKTGFGTVPIRPVTPVGKTGAFCPGSLYPLFSVEKTLDNPACVLGFTCERRERR
jgi:hypothetical protein